MMMNTENEIRFSRVNLYEQIADYVEKKILVSAENGWVQGEKLPSEMELAEQFGVSRNVVREAIKVLKERGLVDSVNGVGAYVTKPDEDRVSAMIYRYILMKEVSPEDLFDVRSLLEVHNAGLAAQRAGDEDLEKMAELLRKMEDRSIPMKERRETDFEFHVQIARATGNPVAEMLMLALREVMIALMEKGIFVFGGIDDAILRHERILSALKSRDASLAADMMREHIEQSRQNYRLYNSEHGN